MRKSRASFSQLLVVGMLSPTKSRGDIGNLGWANLEKMQNQAPGPGGSAKPAEA
jgi:hypothetical protein